MMQMIRSQIVREIPPGENNPRNSEGDFLRLADGRILFAYSRYTGDDREDDCPCDIAALFSEDDGAHFDGGRILVRASEHSVRNVMSVSLLRMQNGDVGLFYLVKDPVNGTSTYVLRRSTDECATFQPPVRCLPDRFAGYYVVNNCRVLQTQDGRIYIPAAVHRNSPSEPSYHADACFFLSEDDGRTFREIGLPLHCPVPSQTGLQEPGILELPGGVLYAHFRTDLFCQYESVSLDGGVRWFTPQPSRFSSPESPMKIARNPFSGLYYAVWNPLPEYNGRNADPPGEWITAGRTPLVVAESRDGLHFDDPVTIEDDADRGFCYPAVYFLSGKEMLLAYCSGGKADNACLCCTTIRRITLQ